MSFALSGCRSALLKMALCVSSLFMLSAPASANSLSFGTIPNPIVAGGTLSTVTGIGLSNNNLGFNISIVGLNGPGQVFIAAYVPAGSLGMVVPTWFCLTPDGWQPLVGSSYVPYRTGLVTGTLLHVDFLSGVDINSLPKAEVYVGYGLSADEMIQAARYKGIVKVY
jgi:hypothetical protein